MLTEIWFKTKDKAIRLPVVPSEFERIINANYETNNVIGLGDVATFGGNGLAQISLSSFFPNHEYSFNAYSNVPKPYDIAHIFKEWKNKGTVVIPSFAVGRTQEIIYEINKLKEQHKDNPEFEKKYQAVIMDCESAGIFAMPYVRRSLFLYDQGSFWIERCLPAYHFHFSLPVFPQKIESNAVVLLVHNAL